MFIDIMIMTLDKIEVEIFCLKYRSLYVAILLQYGVCSAKFRVSHSLKSVVV